MNASPISPISRDNSAPQTEAITNPYGAFPRSVVNNTNETTLKDNGIVGNADPEGQIFGVNSHFAVAVVVIAAAAVLFWKR